MIKKLFYASASILMLALAFYLGAQGARAQGGTIAAAEVTDVGSSSYAYSIVIGRTLYALRPGVVNGALGTVPGTSPVVSCAIYDSQTYSVLLENGDAWLYYGWSPPAWRYQGNVFGGATPASQQTFGQVKAQYRK